MAVAPALAVLALAGCDDDKIVYVDDIPPAVPTGVFTVTGNGRVDIYWNPVRESDVEGYGVYWSDQLDGTYQRLDTLYGVENTHYVDTDVQNGVTYFYAVDAFDFAGHESALSYEAAFDTPRPAGTSVSVFARLDNPNQSGIDFSDWSPSSGGPFVTAWDAPDTDVYFQNVGGVLYAKGTLIGNFWNDIQDLGWTASMDDVSWAPSNGWSVSPNGVELIEEHTYVVWTHDSYFAKLRVTTIIYAGGAPVGAIIDWAYQIDRNNPELIMPARPLDRPADDGRTS
jgi:hypothetical protein